MLEQINKGLANYLAHNQCKNTSYNGLKCKREKLMCVHPTGYERVLSVNYRKNIRGCHHFCKNIHFNN